MIDETYIWSWAEVNGETEEWTIGSIQHTEKEQHRAKEAEETLRTAIKEEQADIKDRNAKEEEVREEKRSKNRAELGIRDAPRIGKACRRGKKKQRKQKYSRN